jgi:endonuclease YncB( thermonuclease family)
LRMNARRVCFSIVAAVLLLLPPSTHAATPRSLSATVERVSDGDTLVATTANQTKLRLRLLGIDAPENAHGTRTP